MHNEYIWTAPGTDITIRWRALGWTPPSEIQEYRDKWRYYQNLPMRQLDDAAKEQYEAVLRKAKVMRIK
jgi:IS1 family transposase